MSHWAMSVSPTADAWWKVSNPEEDRSGQIVMRVRNHATNADMDFVAAVQFPIPFIDDPRVNAFVDYGCHVRVDSASFEFRVATIPIEGLLLYGVSSEWSEQQPMPTLDSRAAAQLYGTLSASERYVMDVTPLIAAVVDAGRRNVTFGLRSNATDADSKLDSKECGTDGCFPPALLVNISFFCPLSPPLDPPPHAPPPPPCKSWCNNNGELWSTKCGWAPSCAGCDVCAPPPVPPTPPPLPPVPPLPPPSPPPPPAAPPRCDQANNQRELLLPPEGTGWRGSTQGWSKEV